AVEICEDLWAPLPPSTAHAMAGATLILNVSASDETIGKAAYRRELVCGQSARLLCGYVYSDAGDGESTTDMVFSGHNLIAENGVLIAESSLFNNGIILSEIDVDKLANERIKNTTFHVAADSAYRYLSFSLVPSSAALTRQFSAMPFVPSDKAACDARCEEILTMQAKGLAKRMEHTGCKTAVVGISGGLDSSLALLVMVRAFEMLQKPLSDILAMTMPCFGTTVRTRSNAEKLCEALGVTLQSIDITQTVESNFSDIGQDKKTHDVTFENVQARVRTLVLMNTANRTNGLVIGTGDLSELALGWATYNGDHMSMYGVNCSVPKTLIRYLVAYAADSAHSTVLAAVLRDILDTPVSPELLPAENGEISQQTEEIVGPYELHDFFLYSMLRWSFSPCKIFFLAQNAFAGQYSDGSILKWLRIFYRRFFSQQFKRSCIPDGPKIGSVTLSPRGDWRMPSDACAALWTAELDALENFAIKK
ncbi:MAG: NAD(+) synthase, partial [Ruthenibacterium sp.]